MLLPFTDKLVVTTHFDAEMAAMADRHYSRRNSSVGLRQFTPPGRKLVIRNAAGTVLFAWIWSHYRQDNEQGYCCCIFRNESPRLSSDIVLECEQIAFTRWGANRMFTYVDPYYVDPYKVRSSNPGCCFKKAGWKFVRISPGGLHLLDKGLVSLNVEAA